MSLSRFLLAIGCVIALLLNGCGKSSNDNANVRVLNLISGANDLNVTVGGVTVLTNASFESLGGFNGRSGNRVQGHDCRKRRQPDRYHLHAGWQRRLLVHHQRDAWRGNGRADRRPIRFARQQRRGPCTQFIPRHSLHRCLLDATRRGYRRRKCGSQWRQLRRRHHVCQHDGGRPRATNHRHRKQGRDLRCASHACPGHRSDGRRVRQRQQQACQRALLASHLRRHRQQPACPIQGCERNGGSGARQRAGR